MRAPGSDCPEGGQDERVRPARDKAQTGTPCAASCYPVLPLRDIVVFPHMIVPLFVGREKSVRALEEVMKDDKQILLVAQKNAAQDDPSAETSTASARSAPCCSS